MKVAKVDILKIMSSQEIAELVDSDHPKVKQSIERLMKRGAIKSYSPMGNGIVARNGVETSVYLLEKRDSYVVVAQLSPEFTARLVDRWQELEAKELARKQNAEKLSVARSASKVEFKPMNIALEDARKELGKETASHHYSNEADMINRIVLGKSSAQFKNFHGIEKDDSVRDHLNDAQIEAIIGLQRANMVYIQDGMLFDERKDRLKSLYMRKFDKAIVAKLYEIEA